MIKNYKTENQQTKEIDEKIMKKKSKNIWSIQKKGITLQSQMRNKPSQLEN